MAWEEADYRRSGRRNDSRYDSRYDGRGGRPGNTVRRGKNKRRRHRGRLLRRTAAIALGFAAVLFLRDLIGNNLVLTRNGIVWGGDLKNVYEQAGDAEGTLRELVKNNPETAGFVRDYPEKKDNPPAETVGEVTQGTIPHLLQWDERWGYQIYGDNMIAVNGCGPTVISMVASGLTGDNTITPYKVAQFSAENGYYEGDAGTSWSLMTEGSLQFGVYGEEMGLDQDAVFSSLENGYPIICSMRPGDFTTTGHFIVLVGVEDGKIRVNDPNSVERSEKLWDYETLEYQINNLWRFSAI